MQKRNFAHTYSIEEVEELKKGFSFVKDIYLANNMAYTMQHIVFSLQVFQDIRIPGTLKYSLGKGIIVDTVSIIEGLCHYWLRYKVLFQNYKSSDFLKSKPKLKEIKEIVIDINGNKVVAAHKIEGITDIEGEVRFIDLINGLIRKRLVSERLGGDLKIIAKWRNMVHLMGLDDEDRKYFREEDIRFTFDLAKRVKKLIILDLNC